MKRIILLRHPETAFNQDPVKLRGGLDVPLSRNGFAQIPLICEKILAMFPGIKQIYSSPLERAAILATTIAHEYGLKVVKKDGLKSFDYGVLNGKPVSEVLDVLKTLTTGAGRTLAPKNGESFDDFLVRTVETVKETIYNAPEEGHVLVVTHLQNIMLAKAYLAAGLPEDLSDFVYEYRETNEVGVGEWIELKRDWVVVG